MAKVRLTVGILAGVLMWPAAGQAIEDIRDLGPMIETLNDVLGVGRSDLSMEYVSPATGNRGRVEAVRPAGESNGRPCWMFRRNYGPPGRVTTIEGRACSTPDGLWEIVDEGTPAPAAPVAGTAPPTSSPPPAPATNLGFPPTRDRTTVFETQQLLTTLGYDPGPSDGLYGRRTGTAISAYQRDSGLYVDGQPSAELLAHIRATANSRTPAGTQTAAPTPAPTVPPQVLSPPPAPAPPPAPVPLTQQATAPPAAPAAPGGEVPIASLAGNSAGYIGQAVNARGTYLHYNGNWAKLLAEDGSSSDFVYILLDALSEAQQTSLRNDCFLCQVRAEGRMEMRELQFAGSSLGEVPTIVVTRLDRLD
jgi:peptidoglycan hydrolase-like protein with peptidoglycan-binding domain